MNGKKMVKTAVATVCAMGIFTMGVYAAPAIQKVTAELNPNVTVQLDGKTQTLKNGSGEVIYPLIYDGSTYLPIRAVADMAGLQVRWDSADKIVKLTTPADQKDSQKDRDTQTGGSSTAVDSSDKTIKDFDTRADRLVKEVSELKAASSYADRVRQYNELDAKIDALDHEIDRYEDQLEASYHAGKLAYDEYAKLDRQLDLVDDKISDLDDVLEYKLGIDD